MSEDIKFKRNGVYDADVIPPKKCFYSCLIDIHNMGQINERWQVVYWNGEKWQTPHAVKQWMFYPPYHEVIKAHQQIQKERGY